MDAKYAFFETIKTEFAPRLRELGFEGSGQNFRRVCGEVIHMVNLQGNKYGGSCAVNLGLHTTFLPTASEGESPDPARIKEYECELRMRLAPDGKPEYWWKFKNWLQSPEKSARHLIDTYMRVGEPRFNRYRTVEQIAAMIPIEQMNDGPIGSDLFGYWLGGRTAFTMARIHRHLGDNERARQFAVRSMELAGEGANLFRNELEAFLSDLDAANR